jgi:hypothetical protein
VQGFFRKHCDGLTLNLNSIRSICSTEMRKAFESKIVSLAHRKSSLRTTGHGKRASERYYNKAERYDVIVIQQLLSLLTWTLMCHRLHDAAIANDAMQRIYDPDGNDVARIKRLRKRISREQKRISREQKLLALLLLRQKKKKTRPHNNEFKNEEEQIDGMGLDNEFENEEEDIDGMGLDNESDSEEEEEIGDMGLDNEFEGGVDAVFEDHEDNHLEEAESGKMECQSHEDGSNNKVDEVEVQMDEGYADVESLESLGGNKLDEKKVQMDRPGSKRDKWTAAEINYVQQWIRLYPYRPVGELYRHVLDDAHAVKHIFHWRHIASVGRLDYMFKKCHKGFKV